MKHCATLKHFLNHLKLGTMYFCDNFQMEKNPAKNSKVAFFELNTVCFRVVFKKSNGAKIKFSSNHLKFYTGYFCGICHV